MVGDRIKEYESEQRLLYRDKKFTSMQQGIVCCTVVGDRVSGEQCCMVGHMWECGTEHKGRDKFDFRTELFISFFFFVTATKAPSTTDAE